MAITLVAASRKILEGIVLRCGSVRGMGVRCGKSQMWIWRQLYQNKGVDLAKAAKVLGHLEVPLRFFLEEVVDVSPAYDPCWALEHCRPRGGARDPFIAALESRFRRLLEIPPTPFARAVRRNGEIEALEEKFLFDRQAATAGLEILGRDLLGSAESTADGRGLARGHLADCARFLRAWGAIRLAGSAPDQSIDAYVLAHRFAVAADDAVSLGLFFNDASRLLLELGQPRLALRFARLAVRHLETRRDRTLVAKALLEVSRALAELGQIRAARLQAIAALRLSPRGQWRIRAPAWLLLAERTMADGNFRRAFRLLERAKANARAGSYPKALIQGRQAVVLARLGRGVDAIRAFRSAARIFEKAGENLDIVHLAVDLAEAQIASGLVAETLSLVRAATPRFEQLGHDTQAAGSWLDLCALILDGRRNGLREQIQRVREALAGSDKPLSRLVPSGLLP